MLECLTMPCGQMQSGRCTADDRLHQSASGSKERRHHRLDGRIRYADLTNSLNNLANEAKIAL